MLFLAYYCYNFASDGTIQLVPYIIYNASPPLGVAPTAFTQAQDDFMGNRLSPYAWNLVNDAPNLQQNTGGYSGSESVNDVSVLSSTGSDSSGVQLSDFNFTSDYIQSRSHQVNKRNRKKSKSFGKWNLLLLRSKTKLIFIWMFISSGSIRTDELYRVPYTEYQKQIFEQSYSENKYLIGSAKHELAKKTNLDPKQVKIWFQNRRAKDVKRGIKLPKPKSTWFSFSQIQNILYSDCKYLIKHGCLCFIWFIDSIDSKCGCYANHSIWGHST